MPTDVRDSEMLRKESEITRLAFAHAASLIRSVAQEIKSPRLRGQLLAAATALESIKTDRVG
jgi:hypothetical protein